MGVESGVAGELIAFVRYVESVSVGEPEAEGGCRRGEVLCEGGGEAGEDAHVVRQAVLRVDAAEIQRRDGKRCANRRDAYALGTSCAGGVDEVDGVDAVRTRAFGEVDDVVEDGHAAEVVVFAYFVGFVAEEGDGEAGERRGRAGRLEAFRSGGGVDELCTGTEDDAVGLRVRAIACIAGGVEEVRSVGVVEDGGAAVVAAVGVGFCEGEVARGVDGGYSAEEVDADGIGGVDCAGGVGVGGVDGVDGGDVTHEGEHGAVGGEMEGHLGLGAEAGDELVAARFYVAEGAVGNFEAVKEDAEGSDLIEEDFRGDAEGGVGNDVVEDERVFAVEGRRGAWADRFGAIGRECSAYGDVVRVVVVDAARDDEIAREEVDGGYFDAAFVVVFVMVFRMDWNTGERGEREKCDSPGNEMAADLILGMDGLHAAPKR